MTTPTAIHVDSTKRPDEPEGVVVTALLPEHAVKMKDLERRKEVTQMLAIKHKLTFYCDRKVGVRHSFPCVQFADVFSLIISTYIDEIQDERSVLFSFTLVLNASLIIFILT